ncbi:MAG: DUF1349 domain-containing protein [Actinomycetota bacterium]
MDTAEFLASLQWLHDVGDVTLDGARLSMRAGPTTDWFNDPGQGTRIASAPVFCAAVAEDCQVSTRVDVEFESTFDAGVLFVHHGADDYAKLCFERAPDGTNTVVSVVTRGVSDDANGPVVDGSSVFLRVSTFGQVLAFHWSADAATWTLLRYFQLRDPSVPVTVGFLAQSPTGDGCTVNFSEIAYRTGAPADVRDGS